MSLDVVGWYLFNNATDAEADLSGIIDYMKELWGTAQIRGQLRGKYIEITGEMDIPED